MYAMRYTNPKLCGYIYRRRKKCGKLTCRCAKDDKHRHTSYQLQYREFVGGKWVQRSEYVPKNKVRALRARIKRAKKKDLENQKAVKDLLTSVPRLAKRLEHHDFTAFVEAKELTDRTLKIKPQNLKQLMQITSQIVQISAAILKLKQEDKASL